MPNFNDWFAKNRNRMTGNWFLGQEPGTINPGCFSAARIKVLIARLSQYQDVCAGITHSYLFQMAASVEGCYADLAFLPPEQDERLMIADSVPLLTATTSKRHPCEFDVIAISNSVLQELVNLPALLKFSGIPLSASERNETGAPLVILGGSNSYTHSILHGQIDCNFPENKGLVDGVMIGDGELVFCKLLEVIRDNKEQLSRKALTELCKKEIPGFYEPSSYRQEFDEKKLVAVSVRGDAPFPVKANKTACLPGSETFEGGPVLYEGSGSSHVVLSAGCPSFCSFCKESWEQKPYRETSFEKAIEAAKRLKANMGLSELSLMTFNANTCTDIFNLVARFKRTFDRVGIKSQRFDAMVKMPAVLDLQFDAGKRTYTCAMEGISDRVRALLQKNLDESTILAGIEMLLRRNMRQMKVFIILTGYENEEDVIEFRAFLEKIKRMIEVRRESPVITFSFATLFRAPQTPMQYAPKRPGFAQLTKMLADVSALPLSAGFDSRISSGVNDALVSEYIAYADRRHTAILVDASVNHGFRYRGEINSKLRDFWQKALKKSGLPEPDTFEKNDGTVFPWDDIDTGINKKYLYHIYEMINSGSEIAPCMSPPWGTGKCAGCGACMSEDYKKILNKLGPDLKRVENLDNDDQSLNPVWVMFEIPEKWGTCGRDFIKTALARRIMLSNPETADSYMNVELLSPNINCWGKSIAKINFRSSSVKISSEPENIDDIRIIRRVKMPKNVQEIGFPVLLSVKPESDVVKTSRDIDSVLSDYSVKNSKQRQNGCLNWEINESRISKYGIEKITLDELSGFLVLRIVKEPELLLLNKFSFQKVFCADFI